MKDKVKYTLDIQDARFSW